MVLRVEQFFGRWMLVIGVGVILLIPVFIVFAQMRSDESNQELIKYRDEYNAAVNQWRNDTNAANANNVFQKAQKFFGQLDSASGAELTGTLPKQIEFVESVQKQAAQVKQMYVQVQVDTMRRYVGEMQYLVHDGMEPALIRGDQGQIDTLNRAQKDIDLWNQQIAKIGNDIQGSNWRMSEQQRLDLQGLQQSLMDSHDNLIVQAPTFTEIFQEMRVPEVQGGFTGSINPMRVNELRNQYAGEQERLRLEKLRQEEEERQRRNEGPISGNPESGGGSATESR